MGSKSKLMDFVLSGLNEVRSDELVVDLFSGSGSLAGAIGDQVPIISNDIQAYSSVLANCYTQSFQSADAPTVDSLVKNAKEYIYDNFSSLLTFKGYGNDVSLEEFNIREADQRRLIDLEYTNEYHLFVKNYSGTWWSADQCAEIDALKKVADDYAGSSVYDAIMSAIMYAMAYASIGTGHYAQYRDAKTLSSMKDIRLYRNKSLISIFEWKYNKILDWLPNRQSDLHHKSLNADYRQVLESHPNAVVYADPPYCFVHYSRFYHALETLVLYDYPDLQVKSDNLVKGRYRDTRHQSPFSIKSQVNDAFRDLFQGVESFGSKLVLSYSNTGMIDINLLIDLAKETMPTKKIKLLSTDYKHMTLGRQNDRERDVQECLILCS